MSLRVEEIHARIGPTWPDVLARLGIPEQSLRPKKAGPCPACGGSDRYAFDNRRQRGDFFCRRCGPGTGFDLLMRVHGWPFSEARRRVVEAAGLTGSEPVAMVAPPPVPAAPDYAQPSARVLRLRRECCPVESCAPVVDYLDSRGLWPLPQGCTLRAHPLSPYFEDGQPIGRFPALVAEIRDLVGELVSLHVTHVPNGRKLQDHEPRKILSPLTGRAGCAVRLVPLAGPVLGIAEGVETGLSAIRLHGIPTWAALNTALLAKFEPPAGVERLVILADRDVPGLEAAAHLMERLQGCVAVEIRVPPAPAKDWNDVALADRGAA